MLCVVEPDRVDEVLAVCDKLGGQRDRDRRGDRLGPPARLRRRRARGRHAGRRARGRVPGLRPRAGRARRRRSTRRRRARSPTGWTPAARCSALLARANLASRRWAFEQYDWLVGSRTVRRPEAADAAVLMLEPGGRGRIAVSIDGNGRRVAVRPLPRRRRGRARVLGQPRLHRRRAARPHELPELRQPGEAAHRLAAHARGGRARRRLPRARRAGRRRQRLALQRGRRRARSTRRRSSAWSASCPTRARAGRLGFAADGRHGRADRRRLGAGRRGLRAGQAARRGDRGRRCPHADLGELRALHAAVRQGVRSGALRSAHDVAEGGLAVALAECCLGGGRGARVDLGAPADEALLFGEGPGAFVVSGSAPRRSRASAARRRVIGTVGGDALRIEGVLDVPLAELSAAHARRARRPAALTNVSGGWVGRRGCGPGPHPGGVESFLPAIAGSIDSTRRIDLPHHPTQRGSCARRGATRVSAPPPSRRTPRRRRRPPRRSCVTDSVHSSSRPGRHEDAAVHVEQPGELAQVGVLVGLEGLVVDDLRRRERHAALRADADGVARQAVRRRSRPSQPARMRSLRRSRCA